MVIKNKPIYVHMYIFFKSASIYET